MAQRKHVLFVGVLPPPLHGQSRINEVLVAALRQLADLRVLDTSPRRLERTSLYYVHRMARVDARSEDLGRNLWPARQSGYKGA